MRTVVVAICFSLVGALVGAWIVHLSEGSDRLAAKIPELGKRLNLCLIEKDEALKAKAELAEYKDSVGTLAQIADRKAAVDEIVKRWNQCQKDKEDLEAKLRGTKRGGTP